MATDRRVLAARLEPRHHELLAREAKRMGVAATSSHALRAILDRELKREKDRDRKRGKARSVTRWR